MTRSEDFQILPGAVHFPDGMPSGQISRLFVQRCGDQSVCITVCSTSVKSAEDGSGSVTQYQELSFVVPLAAEVDQ